MKNECKELNFSKIGCFLYKVKAVNENKKVRVLHPLGLIVVVLNLLIIFGLSAYEFFEDNVILF